MNRRTYLGVASTALVGSVAGCTSGVDGSQYPPYPDSGTTELSGEGPGTSESFEISQDGPVVIDIEHTGSDDFVVALDTPAVDTVEMTSNGTASGDTDRNATAGNETTSGDTDRNATAANETTSGDTETDDTTVATVVNAIGPYDGRRLLSVAPNAYVLRVLRADAEWTATVYDLPVYDDGIGVEPPIERESQLYDVVGPINFGEQAATEFSFDVTGEGAHQVFLVDRNGVVQQNTANLFGEGSETASLPVAGVGYVEIRTTGSWTLTISQ